MPHRLRCCHGQAQCAVCAPGLAFTLLLDAGTSERRERRALLKPRQHSYRAIMSFEGMVRALEALAGTPASAASLEWRHVGASAVRDCAHVQPRPVFELGELSGSPESVVSSVGVGTGSKLPTQLPAPDSVGIVNADHLMKQFRTCMSDLLEERMETVLDSIARIREEVSAVSNLFNGLETRLNIHERRLEKTDTGPLEQAIRSQGAEIRRVAASADVTCVVSLPDQYG